MGLRSPGRPPGQSLDCRDQDPSYGDRTWSLEGGQASAAGVTAGGSRVRDETDTDLGRGKVRVMWDDGS